LVAAFLAKVARHPKIARINDIFFAIDLPMWAFAIYGTGGERSWLAFLMIIRAIDQSPSGFRRVLVYAHLSVATYAGLIVYMVGVEGRPLSWSSEAGKVAIIWLTNMYVCTIALTIERIRARRREAERALRASEERVAKELHKLHAVIDSIPTPTFYKDSQGVYRGCNAAFLGYLGKSREEIIGKSVFDLSPRDLAEVYHKADVALFEARGTQTYGANVLYADGSRHDVIFYKAAFFLPDGSLGGLVGSILDITDRKQREREATRLYEATAALAAARDMDQVLEHVVTHTVGLLGCDSAAVLRYDHAREGLVPVRGVNLPVAIRGAVIRPGEGLTGRAFAERTAVWFRDMTSERLKYRDAATTDAVRSGVTHGTLAVPLLTGDTTYGVLAVGFTEAHDFTQAEVGLLTSLAHQASMAIEKQQLLEEAEHRRQLAETLAGLARAVAEGVDLERVHQADLVRIHGASLRLKRLLALLMQDPAPLVELFARSGVRHELNTPLNHVIGYSELLLEEETPPPFVARLRQVREHAQAIFRIVNRSLTTTPPAPPPAAPPAPTSAAVPAPASAVEAPPVAAERQAPPATERGAVMIVDDDPEHRELLRRYLTHLGHETIEAEHGAQALEILDARRPDVILLDMHMPVMDGYRTLERLKDHPAWREIPVVVLSALDDLGSAVRCLQLGAEDYLHKPCNAVLLNARVAGALTRKRLRDQELAYLNALADVTAAAIAVEMDAFDPSSLDAVAARPDALGQLARVFQRMAHEIHVRQERLDALLEDRTRELRDKTI